MKYPFEPTNDMIEAGAQALVQWENGAVWPDSWGSDANLHRRDARKVWMAMHEVAAESKPIDKAQPVDREGWQLVPVALTEDMHAAAVRTIVRCAGNDDFPPRVYRAMLNAAPQPPAEQMTESTCQVIADCATPSLCLSVGTCKSVHVMPASVRESAERRNPGHVARLPADDTEGGAA